MKLSEINKKIKKLKLPEDQKENIIELIDLKTDDNMDKVLNHIDKSISRFEAAIDKLDHKLDTSIGALNGKLDAFIESLKESNTIVKWIVTGVGAIALTILGKLFKMF